MLATNQRDIQSFTDFLSAIMESRDLMIRQLQAKDEDSERTIGIYTDYIGVTDFKLEDEDKIFGAKVGQNTYSQNCMESILIKCKSTVTRYVI
jgi:hypothetical protein